MARNKFIPIQSKEEGLIYINTDTVVKVTSDNYEIIIYTNQPKGVYGINLEEESLENFIDRLNGLRV